MIFDKSLKYHAENIMDFEHATLIKQIKNEGEVVAKATLIKRTWKSAVGVKTFAVFVALQQKGEVHKAASIRLGA